MMPASGGSKSAVQASRPKLLSLNFFPSFYPPNSGGEQRAYHLLAALSESFDVVSMTPTYPGTRDEIVRFSPTFEEHRFTKTPEYQQWHAELTALKMGSGGADLALALAGRRHSKFRAAVHDHWDTSTAILVQHPCALPMIAGLDRTGKQIVYLGHNCEFELAAQKLTEGAGHEYLSLIGQLEYRLCQMADVIAVVSKEDQFKLSALYSVPHSRFMVVPNGSVSRFATNETFPDTERESAIFIGSNWPPNVEAAQFIMCGLAPRLADVRFDIVGSVCRSLDQAHPLPNVTLHHELSDEALASLLRRTHVGLNPMSSGGGSNVKLADYLAHGLRILTTRRGARGFEAPLANLHLVELEAMAEQLARTTSAPLSVFERCAWRQASKPHWDWQAIAAPLIEALLHPAARESVAARRRFVVLNEFPVRGNNNGGEARVSGLYADVRPDEDIVILSFGRDRFHAHVLDDRTVCIELPATKAQLNAAAAANKASYASVNDIVVPLTVGDNPLWLNVAEQMLAYADGIVFAHPFMLPVYEHLLARRRFVHDSHNVEANLKHEALETNSRQKELVAEVDRQERFIAAHAQFVAACSESDASHFREIGARTVMVAENGVDLTELPTADENEALAAEGGLGSAKFFERNVYFIEEFLDLPAGEFVEVVHQAILKRPKDAGDVMALPGFGPIERARFIANLMCDAGNKRRVFVSGALRQANMPERVAVFMGSGHRPNLSAAEFLVSAIAPQLPDVQFLIVGQVGASMDTATFGSNVYAAGFVSKPMKTALLFRADVGLNPMIGGGGSNLKVPDYLAHGLPVVSSEFGQRGFAIDEKQGLYSASLPEFAERVRVVMDRFADRDFDSRPALEILRKQYAWKQISARYMDAMRSALARASGPDVTVVCEDVSLLRFEPLSHAGKLLSDLAARGRIAEVLVQSWMLTPAAARDLKARIPAAIDNITFAAVDREIRSVNKGQLRYDNVTYNRLEVISTHASDEQIMAALEDVEIASPVILSGAGNVVAADHPWRFVTDNMVVALPVATNALRLVGKAHRPTRIEVSALDGGSTRSCVASGAFDLRIEIDSAAVRIRTKAVDADGDREAVVHLQLNRLTADVGTTELEGNLWVTSAEALRQLGLPSEREVLANGHKVGPVSQELELLVEQRAAQIKKLLAVGSTAFVQRVHDLARRANPAMMPVAFDGINLAQADGGKVAEVAWPIGDFEVGLAANKKELGYLAGRLMKPRGVVLLAEKLNGEVLQFADALQRRSRARFADAEVAVVVAGGVSEHLVEPKAKVILDRVKMIAPDSSKALLAVLGMARLVVVRGDPLHFSRVPSLLDTLGVPGVVWRTGDSVPNDPFATLVSVSAVEDVLEQLWRSKPVERPRIKLGVPALAEIDAVLRAGGGRRGDAAAAE